MDNRDTASGLLLSIVIPAYNIASYIARCLDSVLNDLSGSHLSLVEIVTVDDGSIDDTFAVLKEYANKYANISVYAQENGGASKARNLGISKAIGKYIVFADGDDYFYPGSLSKIIEFLLENSDVDILEYDHYENNKGVIVLKDGGVPTVTTGPGQQLYALWSFASCRGVDLPHYVVWTKAVSRKMLQDNMLYFYEGIKHEDEEWVPKIFAYARHVAYLPLGAYVYCVNRDGSVMSNVTRAHYHGLLKVFDSIVSFSALGWLSEDYVYALKRKASSIFWSLFTGIRLGGKYDSELIKEIEKREYIIRYSATFHRRFFYRYALKVCGIRCFYLLKYGIRDFIKNKARE